MVKLKTFCDWKAELLSLTTIRYPKEWYYSEYGRYCNKVRRIMGAEDKCG